MCVCVFDAICRALSVSLVLSLSQRYERQSSFVSSTDVSLLISCYIIWLSCSCYSLPVDCPFVRVRLLITGTVRRQTAYFQRRLGKRIQHTNRNTEEVLSGFKNPSSMYMDAFWGDHVKTTRFEVAHGVPTMYKGVSLSVHVVPF